MSSKESRLRAALRHGAPTVDFDDAMVGHLASALEDDAAEDDVIEAWSPFLLDCAAASDVDDAREVCRGILRRLRSTDSTSASDHCSTGRASKEPAAVDDQHTAAEAEDVPGVCEWLAQLKLEQYKAEMLSWCRDMGACDMDEVRDHWEDNEDNVTEFINRLAKAGLKPLQRKRILKDVEDKKQRRAAATGTSASSTADATGDRPRSVHEAAAAVRHHISGVSLQFGNPPYTISESLGHGATATVYKCSRMEQGELKYYAVKVICLKKLKLSQDFERVKEKLHREPAILCLLRHAHIVSLFDVVEEPDSQNPDKLYLVMELVEGGELFDYIQQKGCVPEDEAKYVFTQLVEALKYIHEKNIVHRDLKPDNILINEKLTRRDLGLIDVKISDFGHSKLLDDGYSIAHTKVGTPQYWAPEVSDYDPEKGYDAKVDLWSLGVVLYVMLEGTYPFDGVSERLDEQIRKARFYFKDQSGIRPTRDARDLISRLITVSPNDRITLKECESHRWVSPSGMNERVMQPFSAFDKHGDQERIRLPGTPHDFKQLRRDLQMFTNRTRVSATLQSTGVIVDWENARLATTALNGTSAEDARGELERLLQHHFPGFRLDQQSNGYAILTSSLPMPYSGALEDEASSLPSRLSSKELAATPCRLQHTPEKHESFRFIKTFLRVDRESGAGLDLREETKGMRVEAVDCHPGQRNIQAGDLITKIGEAQLSSEWVDEVKQIFGRYFRDGVEIQIKRRSGMS